MKLEEYLKGIGFTDVIILKTEALKRLAEKMCPEPIEDFFVSEYRKSDGERVFNSVFFFSRKYMLESKNVVSNELNLDISCAFKSIERCEVTCVDYNPLEPDKTGENSRMNVEGNFGNVYFTLHATRENCRKLWSIHEEYIVPNIMEIIEIKS